jgi:hypothetical protein
MRRNSIRWPVVVMAAAMMPMVGVAPLRATVSKAYDVGLPPLDPRHSPLAAKNEDRLFHRLIASFGQDYATIYLDTEDRIFCDGQTVYYLRREIQAFIDMWRATGTTSYLDQARNLTQRSIDEATANPLPLIWHDQDRGSWPCFFLESVAEETGGHNQLCDFQGSVGFLMAAHCLQQVNHPAWREIADFVEQQVVEKWLYYKPSVTEWHFTGPRSYANMLAMLNGARDVREHFACICFDLHALGYRTYPYWKWATLLTDLYLTPRYDANEPAPYQDTLADYIPEDWGLFVHVDDAGYTWLSVPNYDPNKLAEAMDTSHANRTTWLAARAAYAGLVDKTVLDGLANTLRFRIWAPEKGPFYFNNYIDGNDGDLNGLKPGRGGNIWFGWHRLAAFDRDLEDLFLSIAYDLTCGGENLPYGAQNKAMQNAPICLEAWGARLLAGNGQPVRFP